MRAGGKKGEGKDKRSERDRKTEVRREQEEREREHNTKLFSQLLNPDFIVFKVVQYLSLIPIEPSNPSEANLSSILQLAASFTSFNTFFPANIRRFFELTSEYTHYSSICTRLPLYSSLQSLFFIIPSFISVRTKDLHTCVTVTQPSFTE